MKPVNREITDVAGYRLAGLIGSGGMGEVYKAYNSSLNRFAAVKILYQKEFTERFRNEAYIQSSVNHPNIARLYEFTVVDDKPCIVMEYVEGESLDAILRRKGRLQNEQTENILRQVVAALAYLNKRDIMHRDIKPQNFKVQPDGIVKMLDFGIAKYKYSPKLTQLGFVVGTLEYLAPEQFEQQPELKSDIWGLGVMTYELLTGYMPFEASNPVTLRSKITKGSFTNPKILIPEISDKLCLIIDKCLRVNPANRITAAEIESILGRKKQPANINWLTSAQPLAKKFLLPGAATIVVLGIILFLIRKPDPKPGPLPDDIVTKVADDEKIMINASGVVNAELIFDNGVHYPLPYPVHGKEGDKLAFTIHADGYVDKKVEIQITSRRSSYEFNLEKNNY